jgi:hypothetical protein
MHGRLQKHILGFSGGNLKERDHLADEYIDGDNIKMDIKAVEWEDFGWIGLSHDRDNGLGHSNDIVD